MDENTRDVLVSAIQVGGGFIGGAVVAWLGVIGARWLERDRSQREQRERSRQDRREVFRRVLRDSDDLAWSTVATRIGMDVEPQVFQARLTTARAALADVQLVPMPPDVRRAAEALERATFDLIGVEKVDGDEVPQDHPLVKKYRAARDAFAEVAQRDLAADPPKGD